MDPPLINETSFSAANLSSYTLTEIWRFPAINGGAGGGGLGLRIGNLGGERDGSVEESTVTDQSLGGGGGNGRKRRDLSLEDESSKIVSTTSSGNEFNNLSGERMKLSVSRNENLNSEVEVEASSGVNDKPVEQSSKPCEPPKQDCIHVRARRGQATYSHSLAERARREKISERMKILQDLVPGCNKVTGKAHLLDEIINYIQSLQQQVEFLSTKLEAVNARMNINPSTEGFHLKDVMGKAHVLDEIINYIQSLQQQVELEAVNARMNINPSTEGFHLKDLGTRPFDASGTMFGIQATRDYSPVSQPEWLHMQIGGSFERTKAKKFSSSLKKICYWFLHICG